MRALRAAAANELVFDDAPARATFALHLLAARAYRGHRLKCPTSRTVKPPALHIGDGVAAQGADTFQELASFGPLAPLLGRAWLPQAQAPPPAAQPPAEPQARPAQYAARKTRQ